MIHSVFFAGICCLVIPRLILYLTSHAASTFFCGSNFVNQQSCTFHAAEAVVDKKTKSLQVGQYIFHANMHNLLS